MSIASVVNDTVTSESVINALKPLPPTISGYSVGGLDDTALDPAGGQTVQINGTGFLAGATITFDGSAVAVVTYVNPNQLTFTSPAKSAGTYTIYAVNPDGGTAIFIPGIIYSVLPTWTTSAGTLGSYYETTSISNTVVASGDAPITYSLSSGSLPTGATLYANGVITGTAPVDSSSTTYSFTIQATDAQLQDSTRSFSLTINVDAVTWVSPANNTTYTSAVDSAIANVALSATDAAGYAVSYSANALPTGITLTGSNIAGTPTVIADSSTLLTATAATTNRTAVRTINWSITVANDPYFEYNTLLIPGASTTFVDDASTNNFAVTINGDTKPNNFNPYTPGYYSNYLDGTGDYLTVPNNTSLGMGSGNFTIEFWVYQTSLVSYRQILDVVDGNSVGRLILWVDSAGTLYNLGQNGNARNTTAAGAITTNTWIHVALVRSSGTTKFYINGTQSGSNYTDSTNYTCTTGSVYIGINSDGSTYPYLGYLSNFRMVKGTAVYTAAFTPPTTPLTAITNTSLLTCQSNRFIDNSTNAFTITVAGNTSISSFDPFVPNNSYSTYGSGYFDGTGDYLRVPTNAAFVYGTGDFTIETWLYFTSLAPAFQVIYDGRANGGAEISPVLLTNGAAISYYTASAFRINGATLSVNTWYHIALSRSSGSTKLFLNGVQTGATYTDTNNYVQATDPFIGGSGDGYVVNGYMTDVRIVKGTAVYTTTFTPPTAPLTAISGTSLLTLQNNQSVNNNVFLDNSTNNFFVTRNGNTTQGTFSPYGGNWSNYFDGTGDYLQTPSSSSLGFGTSNFTMEMWVYSGPNGTGTRCGGNGTGGSWSSGNWVLATSTPGNVNKFCLGVNNTSSDLLFSTTTFNNSQWMHVAITRSGNSWAMFVNGVRESTATSSVSLDNGGSKSITLGGSNIAGDSLWTGYISNFRVVIGTAIYSPSSTTITVPTTPLTAITNTSLLTCQSNRLIDNSINNFTITKTGDTSVQRFSPFNPSSVTPTSYSGYFDGTGDYLTTPSSATCSFGTSSLTIEGWFYLTSASSEKQLFRNGLTWPTNAWTLVYNHVFAANKLCVIAGNYNTGTYLIVSTNSLTLNTWNHIAVVRNVNSWQIYINGVADGSSATWSGSVDGGSSSALFGVGGDATTVSGSTWIGNISNFRAVNGTAVYTSNFTPSTTPLTAIANTSLLTCQSTTFIDNSTNNFTITVFGNSQPTQQNPFGFTSATTTGYTVSTIGGSGYFDGNGDYLTIPTNAAFNFGTGNFTIEAWVYPAQLTTDWFIISASGTNGLFFGYAPSTGGYGWGRAGVAWDYQPATSKTLNAWQHVAISRSGTSMKIFVDGVQQGTTQTNSTAYNLGITSTTIGSQGSNYVMTGNIADVRVVNGTALYTSNFVPPSAPLLSVQNTVLLNNMTGAGVYDAAMINNMETVADAKLSTAISKFGGSSMSFDGTGDYLICPFTPQLIFNGSFTVELWLYFNAIPSNYINIFQGIGASTQFFITTKSNGQGLRFGLSGVAEYAAATQTWTTGTWYHVALVRNGTDVRFYVNGTNVSDSTYTNSTTYSGVLGIGGTFAGQADLNGYIDDLRITRGYARYTSNFTAPTTAFPIY
jgi:hypothetical protein